MRHYWQYWISLHMQDFMTTPGKFATYPPLITSIDSVSRIVQPCILLPLPCKLWYIILNFRLIINFIDQRTIRKIWQTVLQSVNPWSEIKILKGLPVVKIWWAVAISDAFSDINQIVIVACKWTPAIKEMF